MSFNYRIACASSVSQVCDANRSNFFFDGKSMKKENHGTAAPLAGAVNSDAEQCIGVFDGVTSPEAAHVAINCLRYYLKQRQADNTDYIKQLQDYYTASDRVIAGLDGQGDKRVSCAVGFVRYNGFYFASAGDCLVYLWRNGDLTLLNTPETEARPLGGSGAFAVEPIYGEIFTGDRIVMCTTSLKKSMSNDRFRSIIADSASVDEAADTLCKEAMTRGITDCASSCVIEIGEQTSEGYWILPGLIYTPEAAPSVPYFEGDSDTIEITSGSAVSNEPEAPAAYEEPSTEKEIVLPPPVVLPEPETPAVHKPAQSEPKRPSATELHREEEKKRTRILLISCIIAGALLLGLILTFVIIGAASNHGDKPDDTTPVVTTPEDTEEKQEPEDTEDDTTEDTEDDTTEDTEDTSTEETSTDEESTEESEESSEDSTSTEETEEPEPENNTTSRGYTIEYKNGAHYVKVGDTEILVANKSYELSSSYNPGGLTSATKSAFNDLVSAASDAGYTITNVSGFRSYATQQRVYSGWVNTYGQTQADRISARPGHSEHQTGMAIDVNSLDESFGETSEGKWLAKNAHKYGFIIRYPQGKEGITGYAYEPWHIRYVGEIAEDIYNSGLTLEEYLGVDSEYSEE